MSRLYVPATFSRLADWVAAGDIPESAVLDAVVAQDDSEDAEYAALVTAADASATLQAAAPDRPSPAAPKGRLERRRVVLVVETAVTSEPVPMSDVVACHVDTTDRPQTGADPDDDLAWYAPNEIPTLLR